MERAPWGQTFTQMPQEVHLWGVIQSEFRMKASFSQKPMHM